MKRILSVFLAVVFVVMLLLPSSVAFASEEVQYPFDYTSIEDDFEGNAFSKLFDTDKDISVYFMEYAYSPYLSSDYALYVYVYNSTGIVFDAKSDDNRLQFSVNYDTEGNAINFGKYALEYCSQTDDGLITKYRVNCNIYSQLEASARKYFVSSIELDTDNGIKDYAVALKYTFTGFAKGYGSEESTLQVSVSEFETISFDTYHTHYRVQSDTENSFYDIQSVYFNVEDSYITEYGDIYSLVAMWEEYFTTPILITNNQIVYDYTKEILRKDVSDVDDYPFLIAYGVNYDYTESLWKGILLQNVSGGLWGLLNDPVFKSVDGAVYVPDDFDFSGWVKPNLDYSEEDMLDVWNYCFKVSDSAISTSGNDLGISDKLEQYLEENNWDESLFVSVNTDNYDNPIEIFAADLTSITEYEYEGWWIFADLVDTGLPVTFDAIVAVDGNDKNMEKSEFAEKYLVSEQDVSDIQDKIAYGQTTYLLRYSVTPYVAYGDSNAGIYREESEYVPINNSSSSYDYDSDIDIVVAQTTVIKGFDIIEVTFYKDGVYTTLAAVHDPTSYVASITVPTTPGNIICDCGDNCLFCEGDCEECRCWVKYIVLIVTLLLLLFIFAPVLPFVIRLIIRLFSFLIQLVLLPFRIIARAIKKRKKKDENNENRKE